MNSSSRNNRQQMTESMIKSVKAINLDPKKTPKKIQGRSKQPEDKLEGKYFLLKGKSKITKEEIQNETIKSKLIEPLINDKNLMKRLQKESEKEDVIISVTNEEQGSKSKFGKEKKYFDNFMADINTKANSEDNSLLNFTVTSQSKLKNFFKDSKSKITKVKFGKRKADESEDEKATKKKKKFR